MQSACVKCVTTQNILSFLPYPCMILWSVRLVQILSTTGTYNYALYTLYLFIIIPIILYFIKL